MSRWKRLWGAAIGALILGAAPSAAAQKPTDKAIEKPLPHKGAPAALESAKTEPKVEVAATETGSSPPVASPGQCFARVAIAEVAQNYSEERIVAPARTETREVPAVYEVVDVQILEKEPALEWVVTPGVYRTVKVTEVVTPERVVPVTQPAVTEAYMQRVMVRPAYTTWKEGCGVLGRVETVSTSKSSGELLCRVETPARYAEVRRLRVVTPERTIQRTLPAVTREIERQELVTPAKTEQRMSQPVYRTETQRRLVKPASQETVTIPEVRRTEELRRVIAPAHAEWREVLCSANATPERIAAVQRALTARGFATAADGVFGPATVNAMEAFQRANQLATGYLTIETLRALALPIR